VDLTAVDGPLHAHVCFCKQVGDFEVDSDVSCRGLHPLFAEDVEGDKSRSLVVLIALRWWR
jgi:hypothetical protein